MRIYLNRKELTEICRRARQSGKRKKTEPESSQMMIRYNLR
jgi:hypothetical protein